MSPRTSSATAHELSRIGLLSSLPGQTLARLGAAMAREAIPAGSTASEAAEGPRFYVVLAGMLTAGRTVDGARRVLRPGDYFGDVAPELGLPAAAAARALTPATVASCDRATFDELVRPLLARDET